MNVFQILVAQLIRANLDHRADLPEDTLETCGPELSLDPRIGCGMTRSVFPITTMPGYVAKIEENPKDHFQNVIEWETWNRMKGTSVEKWFAPCHSISADGRILIMARTKRPESLPKRVPAFFTDLKAENWGVYKNRLVCHDYAKTKLMESGTTTSMLRVVKWRIEENEK